MPPRFPIGAKDSGGRVTGNLNNIKYSYHYTHGLNFKPGTDLHDKIVQAVFDRAQSSHDVVASRYESWNEIDKTLTAFIPLDEEEKELKKKDPRKPVSIVVPVSYAALETLLTYQVAAFLDSPIFRYEGVGGEDVFGAMLLERIIDLQVQRARMAVQLHTMFRDGFVYGFGAVIPVWEKQYAYKTPKNVGFMDRIGQVLRRSDRQTIVRYEGSSLYNVDPYCYLPDPNVAVHDVQRGEYVGWIIKDNRLNLLSQDNRDGYFNCRYLEHIDGKSVLNEDESGRDRYDVEGAANASLSNRVDVIHLFINIIPREWGLGNIGHPEKWVFSLAGDEVLIRAMPLDLDHNMFPIVVSSPDFDGYSVLPISKLETIYGLQEFTNFLINSHVANKRKAINDMFVVDPELININDMANPAPGKLIRLRRKNWGRGVQNAVAQLAVTDVTAGNVSEAFAILQMVEKGTRSVDSLGGQMKGGERRSAEEFRGTRNSALSHMERMTRMTSAQAMNDLAYMLANVTQQNMSRETYIKISGRYEQELRDRFGDVDRVLVTPEDLDVNYDVVPHDGSLPSSGDPGVWLPVMQQVASNPILLKRFDIIRIFEHLAKISGAKNLDQFMIRGATATVAPDEFVQQQVQAGNMVPATPTTT